jgi:mRNA interferase HigB
MKLINKSAIQKFVKKHPESGNRFSAWARAVEHSSANSLSELKLAFRSADYVPKFTIFDVGGNAYRVITVIDYKTERVYIHKVLTHSEYDKWSKDNRGK